MPAIVVGSFFSIYSGKSLLSYFIDEWKSGYWYLYILSFSYVMLTLFFTPIKDEKQKANVVKCLAAALFVFLLLSALRFLLPEKIKNLFCLWLTWRFWPLFICGFLFRRFNIMSFVANNWGFSASIVLYVVSYFYYMQGNSFLYFPTGLAFIIFSSYLFMQREQCYSFVDSQFGILGRHSLDIYIYHYFIIHTIHLSKLGDWFEQTNNAFLEFLLCFSLTILLSYISVFVGKLLRKSSIIVYLVYGDVFSKFFKTQLGHTNLKE